MTSEADILKRAQQRIKERQFDRARLLLEGIQHNNPQARQLLKELNQRFPPPNDTPNALKEELEDVESELVQAEKDIAKVEEKMAQQEGMVQRAVRINMGILVFLGSLLGSLIGAAADLGGAVETINSVRSIAYPHLCVVGSDTILGEDLGMAQAWEGGFEAANRVRVSTTPIGSTAGFERVLNNGCGQVLAMSEAMSDEQQRTLADAGVEIECAAEIGYDLIVFVTDVNNPVSAIDDRTLRGMLLGSVNNWQVLSTQFDYPVNILVRERSGTTDLVLRTIGGWDSQGGTVFPPSTDTYSTCGDNLDCLNRTLATNGSIYWVSASFMRNFPPQYLRVLPVLTDDDSRPVNPLHQDVDLDEYPPELQRPLYMYVVKNTSSSDEQMAFAHDYLRYVRGVAGQQVLEDTSFFTHFDQPGNLDVPLPVGFDEVDAPRRRVCEVERTTLNISE